MPWMRLSQDRRWHAPWMTFSIGLEEANAMSIPAKAKIREDAVGVDRDQPLVEEVRLLGKILGDTIRDQDGQPMFELVEAIRQLSVAFQRGTDAAAGRNLDALLERRSPAETNSVIRAFTYFSHLANLAE